VAAAVALLWEGNRDEELLCEHSDTPSQVVVRSLLRVVRSMERRLLAADDPAAVAFSAGEPSRPLCYASWAMLNQLKDVAKHMGDCLLDLACLPFHLFERS
jgi:hypothetical protein